MADYAIYIYALIAIIVGALIIKKVAGCILRLIIVLVIIAIGAFIYMNR